MELTPQQELFLKGYLDPQSETFSNAKQSALQAGYKKEYAKSISSLKPKWVTQYSNKLKNRKGFVYLLKTGEFYKIGMTKNVQKRITTLQTATPHKIELLAYKESDNACDDEKTAHKLFKDYRVSGEWFKLPTELVTALKLDLS